nr:hypothetical protein CFP56_10276 [Quercus suber]
MRQDELGWLRRRLEEGRRGRSSRYRRHREVSSATSKVNIYTLMGFSRCISCKNAHGKHTNPAIQSRMKGKPNVTQLPAYSYIPQDLP